MANEKTNEWRRVAIKPLDGKKLDILVALANGSRAANDKLPLYELLHEVIEPAWQKAKGLGLVSDAMVELEETVIESGTPIYERAEEVA